jgi:uncharacterized protein
MHAFGYTDAACALQDRFDTRRLADAELQVIVHDTLTDNDRAFVSASEFFFLATVDDKGSPTVSFKGGPPGCVHVLDDRTPLFPNYDGNGMYYSMGNVATTASVGMLFIAFDRPARLRVQGQATLSDSAALLAHFPGAQFVVQVEITALITNCPRYIPRMTRTAPSRYIPDAKTGEQAIPGWKRIDAIQGVLPARDQNKAASVGGLVTMDEWGQMVAEGNPLA